MPTLELVCLIQLTLTIITKWIEWSQDHIQCTGQMLAAVQEEWHQICLIINRPKDKVDLERVIYILTLDMIKINISR